MSDDFMLGFTAGAAVFSLLAWWQIVMYKALLVRKAKEPYRTAEKLGDTFYYIVPEREYGEMDRMRAWYQNGTTEATSTDTRR